MTSASDYIDQQISDGSPSASDYIDQQIGSTSDPSSGGVDKLLTYANSPFSGLANSGVNTALGTSQALGSLLPDSIPLNIPGYGPLDVGSKAGVGGIRDIKSIIDKQNSEAMKDNPAAKAGYVGGNLIGNVAQFLALAGKNPTTLSTIGAGMDQGLTQPTDTDSTDVFGTSIPTRALNYGLGGATAGIGKGLGDIFSTQVTDPNLAPLMQTATDNNIPVYRNQVANSNFLKAMAGVLKNLPGGGGGKAASEQVGAFQNALNATVGEPAGIMNSATLGDAADNTGKIYDSVKQNPFYTSPQFHQDLSALEQSAQKNTVGDARDLFNQQLQGIRDETSGGSMTGSAAKGIISDLGAAGRGANSSPELRQLRTLVNNQWASTMPSQDAQSLLQADQQWRNLLALERPVGVNPNGPITPSAIQGGVKSVYGNYARGGDSWLENLSRLGQLIGKSFPDSGTATNEKILEALKHVGATVGVAGVGAGAADRGEGQGFGRLAKDAGGAAAAIALARFGISPYVFSKMSMAPSTFGSLAPALGSSMMPTYNSGGQ